MATGLENTALMALRITCNNLAENIPKYLNIKHLHLFTINGVSS